MFPRRPSAPPLARYTKFALEMPSESPFGKSGRVS